jgi:thiamine pyrophosphate-dependent acetolactate synthase large subunit-like protein
VDRAVQALNEGKDLVIFVGKGAIGAGEELGALAERVSAPIVKTLLAKEVLPDDHPLVIGGLGLLGTRPGQEAMERAKTLLIVGASFPFTEYLPDDAFTIQIDTNPTALGLRTMVDVPLLGDAKATLEELNRRVEVRKNRAFVDTYTKGGSAQESGLCRHLHEGHQGVVEAHGGGGKPRDDPYRSRGSREGRE